MTVGSNGYPWGFVCASDLVGAGATGPTGPTGPAGSGSGESLYSGINSDLGTSDSLNAVVGDFYLAIDTGQLYQFYGEGEGGTGPGSAWALVPSFGATGPTGPAGNDVIPAGGTGSRPGSPTAGQMYLDTDLNKPVWYNGSNWIDATGATV